MVAVAVGAAIRARREALGLGVRELARRAELSPAAVSRYQRGERVPGGAELRRLAAALETTADALLAAVTPGVRELAERGTAEARALLAAPVPEDERGRRTLRARLVRLRRRLAALQAEADELLLATEPPTGHAAGDMTSGLLGGESGGARMGTPGRREPQQVDVAVYRVASVAEVMRVMEGEDYSRAVTVVQLEAARLRTPGSRAVMLRIEGDCGEPDLHAGDSVLVEAIDQWRPGDQVLAVVDGTLRVGLLVRAGNGWMLQLGADGPAIPAGDGVRLLGVVLAEVRWARGR